MYLPHVLTTHLPHALTHFPTCAPVLFSLMFGLVAHIHLPRALTHPSTCIPHIPPTYTHTLPTYTHLPHAHFTPCSHRLYRRMRQWTFLHGVELEKVHKSMGKMAERVLAVSSFPSHTHTHTTHTPHTYTHLTHTQLTPHTHTTHTSHTHLTHTTHRSDSQEE